MAEKHGFVIAEEHAGERLDRIVPSLMPGLSRAAAANLIARGLVSINSRPCKAASRPVAGAHVEVLLPGAASVAAIAEQIAVPIVFEDDAMVVVDKPAGMVVHPAPGNETETLVNALLGRYASLPGDPARPGIVHRLDKDTSGLMVVARTAAAAGALARAFKNRDVHKEYTALLFGRLEPASGKIQGGIGRDPRFRQRMAVLASGGREALTTYWSVEAFTHYTLVRVRLETGRTHQIRVHFSAIGHPVAGDPVYGRRTVVALKRQFLHASLLRLAHPITGEEMEFTSALPEDLAAFLARLREVKRPPGPPSPAEP